MFIHTNIQWNHALFVYFYFYFTTIVQTLEPIWIRIFSFMWFLVYPPTMNSLIFSLLSSINSHRISLHFFPTPSIEQIIPLNFINITHIDSHNSPNNTKYTITRQFKIIFLTYTSLFFFPLALFIFTLSIVPKYDVSYTWTWMNHMSPSMKFMTRPETTP